MRNKSLIALLAIVFLLSGCSDESLQTEFTNTQEPLKKAGIDRIVYQQLEQKGEFWWNAVDDQVLWSAAVQSDSILSIGYQPVNEENVNERLHLIDIQSEPWKKVRTDLIHLIVTETNKAFPNKNYTAKRLDAFWRRTSVAIP